MMLMRWVVLGILCLPFAQSHAAPEQDLCKLDRPTLRQFFDERARQYRDLRQSRGLPVAIEDQSLREIEVWSLMHSQDGLLVVSPQGQVMCAWLWVGGKASSHLLATTKVLDSEVQQDLQRMNLRGRAARAVVEVAPLPTVAQVMAQWRAAWLPESLVKALEGLKKVVVLPSGVLAQLPWNALLIEALVPRSGSGGSNQVAAKGLNIVIAANVKAAIASEFTWEQIGGDDQVLIVGNPDYAGSLPQLPGAQREAEFYAAAFKSPALIGAEATVERVRAALVKANVALLATHGFSSTSDGLDRGALAFAGGLITARQIQAMKFEKYPLIVLSACETGLGQIHEAGTIGLARAFQLAGAFGVIMSLWSVDDNATQKLMEWFVHEQKTASPSLALVRAQLRLRETHPDPRHWGAFSYFGEPSLEPIVHTIAQPTVEPVVKPRQ